MEECKHGLTKETCAYCTGLIKKATRDSQEDIHTCGNYLLTGKNLLSPRTRAGMQSVSKTYKENN